MVDQPIVKPEVTQTPPVPAAAVPQPTKGKGKGDKKWMVWGLIGFTVILLVTAVILFLQLRKPVEEPLPKPKPVPVASPELPEVKQVEPEGVCEVSFTIEPSPEPSPSPSPTTCFDTCEIDDDCEGDLRCIETGGTDRCVNPDCIEDSDCDCDEDEDLVCFDTCVTDSECPGDLRCMIYPGTSDTRCLNADCREESDCECPGVTASPTPPASAPPASAPPASPIARVEQPDLPEAGVSAPAVLGVSVGLLMLILGLLF